jgi:diguanylate cyclase (GGDEF)-like protein
MPAPLDEAGDFEVGGTDYRGRAQDRPEPGKPPLRVSIIQDADELAESLGRSRTLIFGILLGFVLLALASSIFVVRALQDQIGEFLEAARRLARGEFSQRVPIEGRDEFAQLGSEFNSMSAQLETKIEELNRKRRELEDTIRRVGEAFATGLDPQSVVDLAVRTAVEACEADAGRALPLDERRLSSIHVGDEAEELAGALEAAEREAFAVRPSTGPDLLAPEPPTSPGGSRRAVDATAGEVHAMAVPMRARLGSSGDAQDVGVISIARRGREFVQADRELLEYLAGQAAVSIENADLHETVQRQAVTDELTGLANVRDFQATLDRELERSRRFQSPLGLVMLDLDDFKKINDTHGHQQGDEVLVAVANVLRTLSRDIDQPVRYGGEELCVVAAQTDAGGATQFAERMREAIERLRIQRIDGRGELRITASFGVAAVPENANDRASLIAAADAALYRAKRAGKNRVERADAVVAPR